MRTVYYIYINSRLKVDITVINMLGDVVMSKEKVNVLDVFKLTPGVYNTALHIHAMAAIVAAQYSA